jgi:hypothetical protein
MPALQSQSLAEQLKCCPRRMRCSVVVWRTLVEHEAQQDQLPTASMRGGAQLPPSTAAATGSLHSGEPHSWHRHT